MSSKTTTNEAKLVPILREGIEIVKIILYKELRDHLRQRYQGQWSDEVIIQVTAAVVGEVFGGRPPDVPLACGSEGHRPAIDQTRAELATSLPHLRIPLTDALRTMALCDYQEGGDRSPLLKQAQDDGLLLMDRDLPLPNQFIDLVRRLGTAMGILQ